MSKRLIIAEIGHNGNGNKRLNQLLIEEAKACGADIAKFQLYDIDKIKKVWQSRYMELKVAQLTKEDVYELAEHCDKIGIEFMASAFDAERVGWLEEVGVRRHKIASRSIYDKELINAMEKTGKPIIASLGAWKEEGFPKIYQQDDEYGRLPAHYLYCVPEYPAYIKELPSFDEYAGFSDHTIGCYWAREAIKKGATIIEKHFTLSHELPGHNQKGSAEPWELKDLVTYARQQERGISY